METLRSRVFQIVLTLVALMLSAGCGDQTAERTYRTVEGTAKQIDPPNNVAMTFVNDEGIERTVSGTVDRDAEIWVDGKQAALEDVKPGDFVKVVGYQKGEGIDREFVATRIEVERETFEAAAPTEASPQGGRLGETQNGS